MRKIYGLLCASAFGLVGYAQPVLTEGFEAGMPPAGWMIFDNGVGTGESWIASSTAHNGTSAAFIDYELADSTTEDWLVTGLIDLAGVSNAELRFFTRQNYGMNYGSEYRVMVSTTSQSTTTDFTLVQSWTESALNTVYDEYEEKVVNLSAYDGQQIYIAFVLVQNNGDSWYIDDVTVGPPPTCPVVTNPVVSGVSFDEATVSWTPGGSETAWNVEYGVTGFNQGAGTTLAVSGTPSQVFSNLNSTTTYQYYIQADCGAGDSSFWVGPFSFTTTCPPVIITTLPWTEGFETATVPELPCGWTSENLNNDSEVWGSTTSYSSTGDQGMVINYNFSEAMNDWAYTPEMVLQAGVNYVLSFKYRTSSSYAEKLEVKIGDQNISTAMTTQLIDLDSIQTNAFRDTVISFGVATDGSYFIGFHGYSAANMYYLAIDDIVLDRACSAAFEVTPDTICTQSLPVVPQINGSLGGVFSGSNGLVVDASTGAITPSASTLGAHTLTYVVSNQNCSDTTTVDLVIENCAGLEESVLNLVQVYPNPTNGILHVEVPVADGSVAIAVTSLSGQKVTESVVANQQVTELNLNALQNGVYLITFTMNDQVMTRRIVLNK